MAPRGRFTVYGLKVPISHTEGTVDISASDRGPGPTDRRSFDLLVPSAGSLASLSRPGYERASLPRPYPGVVPAAVWSPRPISSVSERHQPGGHDGSSAAACAAPSPSWCPRPCCSLLLLRQMRVLVILRPSVYPLWPLGITRRAASPPRGRASCRVVSATDVVRRCRSGRSWSARGLSVPALRLGRRSRASTPCPAYVPPCREPS